MAFFNPAAVKTRTGDLSKVVNYGVPIQVSTIEKVGDAMVIKGAALFNTELTQPGQEIVVNMSEINFTRQLGHNMKQSFEAYAKGAERFAGSEVILSRCYEKEGQIHAYGGAVTKYVDRGEVDRDQSIAANSVVGRLKITMINNDDKASCQVTVCEPGADIRVTMTENGKTRFADVKPGDVVSALRQHAAQQAQLIESKQSGWTPMVVVTLPVYMPEAAKLIRSGEELEVPENSGLLLRSPAGHQLTVWQSQDADRNAKMLKKVADFLEKEGGEAEAIPVMNLRLGNQLSYEIAHAYSSYIETRGTALEGKKAWDLYEKVLSQFGSPDNRFSKLHLAIEQATLTNKAGEEYIATTVVRAVPAINKGMHRLPSVNYTFEAPQNQQKAASNDADVSDEDVGLHDDLVMAEQSQPKPRDRGMGMG